MYAVRRSCNVCQGAIAVKLRKPPYPDPVGTGTHFYIHACHRETAISTAIGIIRKTAEQENAALAEDAASQALFGHMGEWVVESLIQGAWMREYHEWEKATKTYFDGHHARNGGSAVDWRDKVAGVQNASHMHRVVAQLTLFSATVPTEIFGAIDKTRSKVNGAKHSDELFVTEADYLLFVKSVLTFWERLDEQEEFTPPAQRSSTG
jgi:hypothetical protein